MLISDWLIHNKAHLWLVLHLVGETRWGGPGQVHVRGEGVRRGQNQKWLQGKYSHLIGWHHIKLTSDWLLETGQGARWHHPGQTGLILQGSTLTNSRYRYSLASDWWIQNNTNLWLVNRTKQEEGGGQGRISQKERWRRRWQGKIQEMIIWF